MKSFGQLEEIKIVEVLNYLRKEGKINEWTNYLCELRINSKEGIIHNSPAYYDERQRLIKIKNSKEVWVIEDWWDRKVGKSWKLCVNRVGVLLYFCRIMNEGISTNDEVIYCNVKTDKFINKSALIHESEVLEWM